MQPQDPNAPNSQPGQDSNVPPPYPGFGQRHDIFYQYQPPEAEREDTSPQSSQNFPKPPPGMERYQQDPVYDQHMIQEEETYEPETGGHKKLFIVAGLAIVIVIGVAVLALKKNPGTGKKPAAVASNQTQVTNANPDRVDTPCYTFILPKPHVQLSSNMTSCAGTYNSGTDSIAGVTIAESAIPYASLEDMVSTWKTNSPDKNVSNQNAATFGQYSAAELFWTPTDSPSESYRTVLVYIPINPANPQYSEGGQIIYGFEVTGRYDSQSSSKTVFDSILSSWTWK